MTDNNLRDEFEAWVKEKRSLLKDIELLKEQRDFYEEQWRAGGWISVKDEFPDPFTYVIAFTPHPDIKIRFRIISGDMLKRIATEATHWTPLPLRPVKYNDTHF